MNRGRLGGHLLFAILLFLGFFKQSRAQERDSDTATLKVSGSVIDVTLPAESMKLSRNDLLGWVRGAANAVATYYGRFPVPHLTLRIRSSYGSAIRHGVTYPTDGGLILISVGRDADLAATKDDWVLVHEMIHLAFPSMPDEQHWIEEGISTYVEPVARVRVGLMPLDELWRTFIRDMPKGEPESGDKGLDNTHTWGRTYWGGAMFCLVADVRIRERTGNRKSLQDALRGIVRGGGNITEDWNIEKTLHRHNCASRSLPPDARQASASRSRPALEEAGCERQRRRRTVQRQSARGGYPQGNCDSRRRSSRKN
jgi:hypothetical protein